MNQRQRNKQPTAPAPTVQRAVARPRTPSRAHIAVQRLDQGVATPEDLQRLQATLGNEAVQGLLARRAHSTGATTQLQRQNPEDEGEEISAYDKPSGGLWGGLKQAWSWFKGKLFGGGDSQKTTPESGTPPEYVPQEGSEPPEETGEWADEELQY